MLSRTLSSLQHPIVKYLVNLRKDRDFRRAEKKVLVCGLKLIRELVEQKIKLLMLLQEEDRPLAGQLQAEETLQVSASLLKKISGLEHPEPIAAVVSMPIFKNLSGSRHLLVLDGISDPGNLGTLIRSALAFGWDGVFILEQSCDPFNEKAIRSAKGATFRIPMQEGSWEEFLLFLQTSPRSVYLADIQGTPIDQIKAKSPLALILSRESQGARNDAKKRFAAVTIPMQGAMESLNVASAGAILLHSLKETA